MFRTLRRTTLVALAVVLVASAVALAADGTVSGTLQQVDPQKERITLKSDEGKIVELQAPASLLSGLRAGDTVAVRMTEQQVTSIYKQGRQQWPGMSATKSPEPTRKPLSQ